MWNAPYLLWLAKMHPLITPRTEDDKIYKNGQNKEVLFFFSFAIIVIETSRATFTATGHPSI